MSPTERPDYQPEQSGVEGEGTWFIREGEMTPNQIRNLGRYLYLSMFYSLFVPSPFVGQEINERALIQRTLSADIYIESFAQAHGLNAEVFKKWTHAASIELAHEHFAVTLAQREADIKRANSAIEELATRYTEILDPIARVATNGVQAALEDHIALVEEVGFQLTDRYLREGRKHFG